MIRVLIADDQKLFADMLKTIIQTYEGFKVVAYAGNGEEAYQQYKVYHPDICLLDIQMPDTSGLHALKKIKAEDSNAKVIMLTTFRDDENIIEAYLAGADGYLLKDILPQVLIDSIQCILADQCVMNKSVQLFIAQKMLQQTEVSLNTKNFVAEGTFDSRDIEIMCLIARGMSNKAIAVQLNYSEGTVRNRISNLIAITGLSDRTQIALFAMKNRLV